VILVGELALWIALLMAAWGAIVSFAGARADRPDLGASGERATYATFACLVLAAAGLLVALVTSDFSFAYVASNTTANLPVGYKITALWAAQPGALLLWTLILGTCSAMTVAANQMRNRALMPHVVGTLSLMLLLFLALLCFRDSPYERTAPIPAEGTGMHPDLQHPSTALHRPILYAGYVAATLPLAFAMAGLLVRRVDQEWGVSIRRWATVSWLLLTVGMVTGMWRAHIDPSRQEHWAWDPVRSWALWPWLGVAIIAHLAATRHRVPRLTSLEERASRRGSPRVRVGAYVAGIGAIVLLAGLGAIPLDRAHDVSLRSGEAVTLVDPFRRSWTFTSQGVSDFPERNRGVEAVALRVTRSGTSHGLISSERRQYVDSRGAPTFGPSLEAGIDRSPLQDTYLVLTDAVGDRAEMRIAFHPLRTWVWLGGIAFAIGGSMVMWPLAIRESGS
jgi:cytochrome c biogenesis factor